MSHQALAQVTVRMRFDPSFARAVYDNPAVALRDEALTQEEISWIHAVDRRAWGTDPLLRARTLRTLYEESRGASTLVLAELRRLSVLYAYFSSPSFHAAMRARGSLFAAYAAYLRSLHLRTPQLEPVLRLEESLALCRRELELEPERTRGAGVVRAPGVGAIAVDGCALSALNKVEEYLFEVSLLPGMALAQDAPKLPPLPPLAPQTPLFLVLQPVLGGSGIRELGPVVQRALVLLERPMDPQDFVSRTPGLSADRARALLRDLEDEGLVQRR